jgi:hypothetical protein
MAVEPSVPSKPISLPLVNEIGSPSCVPIFPSDLIADVTSSRCSNSVVPFRDNSEPFVSPCAVVYYGRLQQRLPAWRRLASPFIVDWIEHGVPVSFDKEPTPYHRKAAISNR